MKAYAIEFVFILWSEDKGIIGVYRNEKFAKKRLKAYLKIAEKDDVISLLIEPIKEDWRE